VPRPPYSGATDTRYCVLRLATKEEFQKMECMWMPSPIAVPVTVKRADPDAGMFVTDVDDEYGADI
jgi:hypothetical protein